MKKKFQRKVKIKLSRRALVVNVCFLTSLRSPARTLICFAAIISWSTHSLPSLNSWTFNVLSFISFSSTDPIDFIFVLSDRLYPVAFNSDSSLIPRYQFLYLAHSDTNTWHLFFTSLLLSFLLSSAMGSFIPELKPCVALSSLFVNMHQASSVFSFKNS